MAKYGIPYMGSKRKLAGKIVDFIESRHSVGKVYDLFGGGGAVSFEFLSRGWDVTYNDLDTAVVELLRKIQKDGVDSSFYRWISREDFHRLKGGSDWYAGVVRTCWSFGNNAENGYLFSVRNEEMKELLHRAIVDLDMGARDVFHSRYGVFIPDSCFNFEGIHDRRIAVMRVVKGGRLESVEQLQQLERLQQLEQLERLQQLERLEILNMDYRDVPISGIIYCDPPYAGTRRYGCGMDYGEFVSWVKGCKYPVYVSGYDMDLECVMEMEHSMTLHPGMSKESRKRVEKLFWNGVTTP